MAVATGTLRLARNTRRRPAEVRLTDLEVRVAELRDQGLSLNRIDRELTLAGGTAAKKLKTLRNKRVGLIKLVRRLQDIGFWEKQLDRKKHLESIRAIQSQAKERGVWRYGRTPAGYWLDKNNELRIEPVESEILSACSDRVLKGETVYKIAMDAGYDHRTLRDILKNSFYSEHQGGGHPKIFPQTTWQKMQEMLTHPPKGGVGWGFKRHGNRIVVDEGAGAEVAKIAELRTGGWSSNRIASELHCTPEVIVGKIAKLRQPSYERILGKAKWQAFLEADTRIKTQRVRAKIGIVA